MSTPTTTSLTVALPSARPQIAAPEKANLAGTGRDRPTLSHSTISTQLTCDRKLYIDKELRLSSQVTSTNLVIGTGFAKALEKRDPAAGAAHVNDEFARMRVRVSDAARRQLPPDDDMDSAAHLVAVASRAYLDHYGPEEDIEREIEVRVPIRDPETGRAHPVFDLQCFIDGASAARRMIVEDKFRKDSAPQRLEVTHERVARRARQLTIEAYSIWRVTGMLPPEDGIRYRNTLRPQLQPMASDGDHDGTLARIAAFYERPAVEWIVDVAASRTVADFAELERSLWVWAEARMNLIQDNVWPQNTDRCSDYGGCDYRAVCDQRADAGDFVYVRPPRLAQQQLELPAAA